MMGLGKDYDLVVGVLPLDFQTARTGDFVDLKGARGVTIVVIKNPGTDGDDQTFTLQQATAVGATPKDLACITEYFQKEAATDLTGTGTWTRVTQTAAATVAPGDPSAQYAAVYAIHVEADQLDIANGYSCINFSNDGAGSAAQLGTILYILEGLRYPAQPTTLINPIT